MNTPMERANFSRRAAVWTALLLGWPAAAAAGVNEWTSTGPGQTINIVVPGVAENRLYAGSVDGLYRSDNDAGTWERLTDSLTGHNVLSVVTAGRPLSTIWRRATSPPAREASRPAREGVAHPVQPVGGASSPLV